VEMGLSDVPLPWLILSESGMSATKSKLITHWL
jgi:hypothetical protein